MLEFIICFIALVIIILFITFAKLIAYGIIRGIFEIFHLIYRLLAMIFSSLFNFASSLFRR